MKDTLKPVNTKSARGGSPHLTFHLLLFAFCFVAAGCDNALQKPFEWPHAVSVDNLVPVATQIVREALADEDPYVRVNAVEVVATTKRIRLMPQVRRLLEEDLVPPVRFAAILAVGDLEYRLAERSIAPLLKDPDQNIRIAAVYAMNKLGSAQNLNIIRNSLASDDQTVRANAALLLGKIGDKSALRYLWWTLGRKDSDDKVRLQAIEAIAMLGDEKIYQQRLWAMLISAYADDRVIGIRAMGALGTPGAKEALITKLDDDVLQVRLAAAEQLGMLGDTTGEPEVLDVFRKNLIAGLKRGEIEQVNVLTALAIGRIGTTALRRFLPQLLQNESKFVRIAAAKAVFQCTAN